MEPTQLMFQMEDGALLKYLDQLMLIITSGQKNDTITGFAGADTITATTGGDVTL